MTPDVFLRPQQSVEPIPLTGPCAFDCFGTRPASGLKRWREQRRRAQRDLARCLGLPLGHPVEVWLINGIGLCGKLGLVEHLFFVDEDVCRKLKLVVDRIDFTRDQIQSCVRAP